jgi:hypothetical protein
LSYSYIAHGLWIESEIELPELPPAGNLPDEREVVRIRLGETPQALAGSEYPEAWLQILPGQVLFRLKDVADLYVHQGETITIQPADGGKVEVYRQYVIGYGLGAILHLRGLLVLHGSSVLTPRGALVFVGDSGAGKSTIAAAFQLRGYPLLTDDLCHVDFDNQGCAQVHPGSVQVKLYADSAAALSHDLHGGQRLPFYEDKYTFPALLRPALMEPAPLHAVCELCLGDGEDFELQVIQERKLFRILLENTYGRRILRFGGRRQIHFDQISQIASQVIGLRNSRPAGYFRLDEMLNRIEGVLQIKPEPGERQLF